MLGLEITLSSMTNLALSSPIQNHNWSIPAYLHQVASHTPEHVSFPGAVDESKSAVSDQQPTETPKQKDTPVFLPRTDVDGVSQDDSFEGYAAELRQCQSKMRNGPYSSIHPPRPLSNVSHGSQNNTTQYKATFV